MKSSGFFPDMNNWFEVATFLRLLQEDLRAQEEENPDWWIFAEDGSEYDLDPFVFPSEKEYNEALRAAKRKYAWRDTCEDGTEYFLDPKDYETEEEYMEDLNEAKYAWRDLCFDSDDYGLDPEDYETEEEYNEARDEKEAEMHPFSPYLSADGVFLFSRAIRDKFNLSSCPLPEEFDEQRISFEDIMLKLIQADRPLSLKVWDWCLEVFMPYVDYDFMADYQLSTYLLKSFSTYNGALPEDYITDVVDYMAENPSFMEKLVFLSSEPDRCLPKLIAEALVGLRHCIIADTLFKAGLEKAEGDWAVIYELVDSTMVFCWNSKNTQAIVYFRDHLLPMVREIPDQRAQDQIPVWEKEVREHIAYVEENLPETRLSRELAHLASLGPDPVLDSTVYWFCGVQFSGTAKVYQYRTDDTSIQVGDRVIVAVGKEQKEVEATVVSVGQYSRHTAPFDVDRAKKILRKA